MKINKLLGVSRDFIFGPDTSFQKPKVIQFPVNDICNSKCQMCRIWENKKSQDITLSQLELGLSDDLFSEVEAIGFNGGEPTLRDDLIELVRVAVNKLPKLKHVSLITNAYKYKKVIEQIDGISHVVKSKELSFDVMVSLDGFGEIHDKVRGRSGNFENAKHVLNHVKNSTMVDNLRVGCTIIKENVFYLADLLEFCIDQKIYIKYRLGVPHQRLYTENLLEPYSLSFEEKYELIEFLENLIIHYETNFQQNYFYRSLIQQIVNSEPRTAGCDWQHRGATITAKGELAYCAIKSKSLTSDISKGDLETVYFGNKQHLDEIRSKHCDSCNHDYVGLLPKAIYRKKTLSKIVDKLKIKSIARVTPGFNLLNRYRANYKFNKLLEYHRQSSDESNISFNSEKKVMICGWYGTETLGDKAIIGGVMHAFRNVYGENTKFVVVSLHTYISDMTKRQMPEFRNTSVVSTSQGLKLIDKVDVLAFGGGPLMSINDLAPIQALFERAKAFNVKTIITAAGIGPFGNNAQNKSIETILNLSDIRIYRDAKSKEHAKHLGINVIDDIVSEDPAFTWLATQNLSKNSIIDKPKTLLLGLRDFPYKEYARHLPISKSLSIKENYEREVIKSLEIVVGKYPDITIKPLPMCTNHYGSDDRWFYRRLFRGTAKLERNMDYSLLGRELPPEEYYKEFRNSDALLAMRFHSLVFGISTGLPSVALDYTLGKGKVSSLAAKFRAPILQMENLSANDIVSELCKAIEGNNQAPLLLENLTFTDVMSERLKR